MNCREVIAELSNYLDGDLDADLKKELEVHVHRCSHCRVVFDTTRKTIELYCDGKLFPLPTEVRARLHEAIRRRWHEKSGSA
ncbi:MAG TPA: zf-HC2 domain-containing protein [Terriglobia bacterium]|nr:zf-HC2 domain-containing protein [Terriglobia bacterium]